MHISVNRKTIQSWIVIIYDVNYEYIFYDSQQKANVIYIGNYCSSFFIGLVFVLINFSLNDSFKVMCNVLFTKQSITRSLYFSVCRNEKEHRLIEHLESISSNLINIFVFIILFFFNSAVKARKKMEIKILILFVQQWKSIFFYQKHVF